MKVHQSECARYGPSHFQQMWISKGGFDESSPCVVHRRCTVFTLVIFLFFDAVTDFHCYLSLTHHVHVSKKINKTPTIKYHIPYTNLCVHTAVHHTHQQHHTSHNLMLFTTTTLFTCISTHQGIKVVAPIQYGLEGRSCQRTL